jgi:hypothetical protein
MKNIVTKFLNFGEGIFYKSKSIETIMVTREEILGEKIFDDPSEVDWTKNILKDPMLLEEFYEIALKKNQVVRGLLAVRSDWAEYLIEKFPYCHCGGGWNGIAPLERAASNDNLKMVKYLIKRGAKANAHNSGAFYAAKNNYGRKNRMKIMTYLVKKGANPHALNDAFAEPERYFKYKAEAYIYDFMNHKSEYT